MRTSILIIFFGLLTNFSVQAQGNYLQKPEVISYINQYFPLAMEEQWRTGVPAAIKLAQAILESASGSGDLALRSNNHFGIKCKSSWTGEKVYHDDDASQECFRAYTAVIGSFIDHSNFLKDNQRYAALFTLDVTDYEGWAKGLKKAGYATNPAYSGILIRLIETYKLFDYTLLAIEQGPGSAIWASNKLKEAEAELEPIVAPEDPKVTPAATVTYTQTSYKTTSSTGNSTNTYPASIFKINDTKVYYAKQGTSLLALAQQHHITLANLLRFNDLEGITILPKNELIYLEKKKKKANTELYTCIGGEKPWEISQQLGIQMTELLKLNAINVDDVLPKGKILKAS